MDQLILLVVVGVIAFVKWFMENAGQNAPDSQRNPSAPRSLRPGAGDPSQTESEEERMRRFMEALGLPQTGVPPPVRKPIQRPAPLSQQKPPLPSPKPHPRQLGRPLPGGSIKPATPAHRPNISTPLDTGGPLPTLPKIASVGETAPSMEVTNIPQMTFAEPEQAVQTAGAAVGGAKKLSPAQSQEAQGSSLQAALRADLKGPDALRKAFLLREILGAPKGLQSAQSPSTFTPL